MPQLTQTAAPASEPLTTAEAKLYLRVDQSAEDALIAALISAARERAEIWTQRQIITASYTYSFGRNDLQYGYNGLAFVHLPKSPLASVVTVKYYDATGTLQTASNTTYRVETGTEPGRVIFISMPDYDSARDDGLQVNYSCGYGNAAACPAGLKAAMQWMIGSAYTTREDGEAPNSSAVERLLNMYRVWR